MSKFLIEDDYYIVPLDNCYGLGKLVKRNRGGKKVDDVNLMFFHTRVSSLLKEYCEIRRREACAQACDGTIQEMMRIISSENERLSAVLESLRREMGE